MAGMNLFAMGFLVGVGSAAPGVSGGSMAIGFGIYERMVGILTDFRKKIRSELGFLVPLSMGIVAGVVVFLLGLSFLFDRYEFFMRFLFAGVMLGTFPSVYSASVAQGYKGHYPIIFIVSMLISLFGYRAIGCSFGSQITPVIAFVCGIIIGVGTIIPGVSSSAVLMALGLYKPLISAMAKFEILVIIPVIVGFVIAVVSLLRVVKWMFEMCHGEISFVLFGLLGSSVAAIVPRIEKIDLPLLIAVALFISGAIASYLFGKMMAQKSCD